MLNNNFLVFDYKRLDAVVNDHLKHLSPAQRVDATAHLIRNTDKLYQGIEEGLRLCLDEWIKQQNGEKHGV